jgi:hypothetical protein
MTYHWRHEVSDLDGPRDVDFLDASERLMPKDESVMSRRCSAVLTVDDLTVRSAHADGKSTHQHVALALDWQVIEACTVRGTRDDGQCAHAAAGFTEPLRPKPEKNTDSRRGTIDTMLVP